MRIGRMNGEDEGGWIMRIGRMNGRMRGMNGEDESDGWGG